MSKSQYDPTFKDAALHQDENGQWVLTFAAGNTMAFDEEDKARQYLRMWRYMHGHDMYSAEPFK